MGNIRIVTLNFNSSVDHSVNGLVDDNGGSRLFHDFVDLVALGADEEGDHALGYEDDDGKGFGLDFFEFLVDIIEQKLSTLKLLLHLSVINLQYTFVVT